MAISSKLKLPYSEAGIFLLTAVFCTYLRISFLAAYPLIILFAFYLFGWKLQKNGLYLLLIVLFLWLVSFRNGFYLRYNLLSFYYFIPFILLLFATPSTNREDRNYFGKLMNWITVFGILNNIPGIVQYIMHPGDDNFVGIYGRFTVSQNGLTIINAILFFYHLLLYQQKKKKISLVLSVFFIVCSVMGFYGAGMMIMIGALALNYLRLSTKHIVRLIFLSVFCVMFIFILMKLISPDTLNYNIAIIQRFLHGSGTNMPRKLIIFHNYFEAYTTNISDLLLGSGPGTFNSRSAFMVGSPSYFNVDFFKSEYQPYYFLNYAYPLWNASNTGPYDGFMNQPFSSLLSVAGEYGLIFWSTLLLLLTKKFNYLKMLSRRTVKSSEVSVASKMYRFCSIYLFLLIIIDNYIEYPEIIGLLLIIVKLSEHRLIKPVNIRMNQALAV